MRLERILFSQGFGSHRECGATIARGEVRVGGAVVDDPDAEFDPEGLELAVKGEVWPVVERAVIALNKPAGYECSMKPGANPSVMTLLPWQLRERGVQPVGRLDADTTGLLILTDDGALSHRLTHPKRHVDKVYLATCRHPVTRAMVESLLRGVVLDDDPKPVRAVACGLEGDRVLRMTLDQGRYHQVKRMVAAVGNRVEALRRVRFGRLDLPAGLQEGRWVWTSREAILGGKA